MDILMFFLIFLFLLFGIPIFILTRIAGKNAKITTLEKRLQELENAQKNIPAAPQQQNQAAPERQFEASLPIPAKQEENIPAPPTPGFAPDVHFENMLGGNWFTKIGVVTLLFGIAFLFNYAYQNDWVGPMGWVSIGIILSAILMGLGEWLVRSYRNYANTLTGGGLAILFLSLWAMGPAFYGLVAQPAAFVFLMIATALGFALALRYDAIILMLMAVAGGFLTPFLAQGGFGDYLFLFGYLAFLNIGILAISMFKRWKTLNIVGLMGTALVFSTWYGSQYTIAQMALTELFAIIFFVIFSLSTVVYALFTETKIDGQDMILIFTVPFLYYVFTYNLLAPIEHAYSGIVAVGVSLWYLFLSLFAYTNSRDDKSLLYSFLALALTFFNIWVLVVLNGSVITSIFLLEAAALVFASFYLELSRLSYYVRVAGLLLAILGVVRLLIFDTHIDNLREYTIIFNVIFLNYLIAAATLAFIGATYRANSAKIQQSEGTVSKMAFVGSNLLLFFALNYEVSNYWEKQRLLSFDGVSQYSQTYYDINGHINNAVNVSYSVLWMLYAMISLVVGIATRASAMRLFALGLFVLTIVKIFLYDMNALTGGYRILSFISLGILLILTGFLYQKYKDIIMSFVKE